MAKIHFFYSSMNAGKTTHLLQANHNYINDGFNTMLIKPRVDDRFGETKITSRLGCEAEAVPISDGESIKNVVLKELENRNIDFILADEVQFFSAKQIQELGYLADQHGITVMAYGLRNNFRGELFEGSKTLFEIANNLTEIKKICHCGQKATMVLRYNEYGMVSKNGDEIEIGAEDSYVSVCRKDFFEEDIGNQARKNLKNKKNFDLTTKNRLMREKHANIISRVMGWNFKVALEFAEPDVVVVLSKIEEEIERIKSIIEEKDTAFILRIHNERILSELNMTKITLIKEN